MVDTTLTDAELARLEELAGAITGSIKHIKGNGYMSNTIAQYMGTILDAVPSLVAEVRRLRAELARTRGKK